MALHCDGSLLADTASYGGLIRNTIGDPILAFAGKREDASVLSMELLAILRGVSLCLEKDLLNVSIRSNSKLAVDILNGKIICPWSVQVLKSRIISLFDQLHRKEIQHAWREVNQPADYVAAIDVGNGESILYPLDLPRELLDLI
ncbi:uncharacterized protein LOC122644799 [Telopea speciosissima]|uniref:uncharacterized protein LOC122644799 n=1 Tax=Telopea speciosissima TaxID=54955 RepID=UPI001CC74B76|nr:uncharacterized protein LOC122644799 [Telopea speciosissima]